VKAVWIPGVGCQITETNNRIFVALFTYSMCFDLIVLLLNTYRLVGFNSFPSRDLMGQNRLARMIFADGLIFFILAFLANLIAAIFVVLSLNQIMSVMFGVPAAVCSTIVACRCVRRLTNFTYHGPKIYAKKSSSDNRPMTTGKNTTTVSPMNFKSGSGVHLQMETFTHTDDNQNSIFPKAKKGSDTDVEIDIERNGSF